MASGPPGEAEKLFEALGKHIATRPGQPLHCKDASVYLGTRLWSTKFGFVEMPKEGHIEGIRNIADQAGLHVRGGRGAATPGIKDKPKTKDDEEYIGTELHSTYRQIVGKVQYIIPRRPDSHSRRLRDIFRSRDGLTGTDWADWFDICVVRAAMQCICSTQATRENSLPIVIQIGLDARRPGGARVVV